MNGVLRSSPRLVVALFAALLGCTPPLRGAPDASTWKHVAEAPHDDPSLPPREGTRFTLAPWETLAIEVDDASAKSKSSSLTLREHIDGAVVVWDETLTHAASSNTSSSRAPASTVGRILVQAGAGARAIEVPSSVRARAMRLTTASFAYPEGDPLAALLRWAETPLGTTPPLPRSGLRFRQTLTELDTALSAPSTAAPANATASGQTPSREARALRRVLAARIGRRIVGTASPLARVVPLTVAKEVIADREALRVSVSGPCDLRLNVRPRGAVSLRVAEGETTLFEARVHHARSFVRSVPPGPHVYRLAIDGAPLDAVDVSAEAIADTPRLLHPVDEQKDLETALSACTAKRDARVCAAARTIAASGHGDPAEALEAEALAGDARAFDELRRLARGSPDPAFRTAYARAFAAGTQWSHVKQAAADAHAREAWSVEALPPSVDGDSDRCAGHGTLLGDSETVVDASPYRGAFAIELVLEGPCDDPEAVVLDVDGKRLTASPSSPRTRVRIAVRGPTARVRRVATEPAAAPARPGALPSRTVVRIAPRDVCPARDIVEGVVLAEPGTTFHAPEGEHGLELWLREGRPASEVLLEHDGRTFAIIAHARDGMRARAPFGPRFVRVATAHLPAWTDGPLRIVRGSRDLAVRPMQRVLPQRPLDVSQADDAEPSARVHPPSSALGLAALPFGLDADFAPTSRRCAPDRASAAARIAALEARNRERRRSGAPYAFEFAEQALALLREAPDDPRVDALVRSALTGGTWRLVDGVTPPSARVLRDRIALEPAAHARPASSFGPDGASSLEAVDPLDTDDAAPGGWGATRLAAPRDLPPEQSVRIVHGKPLRLAMPKVALRTTARIEIACGTPNGAVDAGCPLAAQLGNADLTPAVVDGNDQRVTFVVRGWRPHETLTVALRKNAPAVLAFARVVFERPLPGTTFVPNVGHVFMPSKKVARWAVRPGEPLSLPVRAGTVLRIDARSESDGTELVLERAEGEQPLRGDGVATVLAFTTRETVVVRARTGLATVAFAARVPLRDDEAPALSTTLGASVDGAQNPTPARGTPAFVVVPPFGMRDAAARTAVEERPGTLTVSLAGVYGTLRDGGRDALRDDNAYDGYAQQTVALRVGGGELGLYGTAAALVRTRFGEPTFGGRLSLWERSGPLRLRIFAGGDAATQRLVQEDGDEQAWSVRPRAFLERSFRLAPWLVVLPRLGYDGFFSTTTRTPWSLAGVDHDVVSPYRRARPHLLVGQALLFATPHVEDALFVRARVAVDAQSGELASAGLRPGGLVALGPLELSAHVDALRVAETPGALASTAWDIIPAGHALAYVPVAGRSAILTPGVAFAYRAFAGSWESFAFLGVALSRERGTQDVSSFEAGFFDGFLAAAAYRGSGTGTPR
jgi:hypothetical protein